jgi:hypothetical protein
MKAKVQLQQEKMTEREVRDSIARAAAHARAIEQQKGKGDRSQEEVRREMQEYAERDHRRGKI